MNFYAMLKKGLVTSITVGLFAFAFSANAENNTNPAGSTSANTLTYQPKLENQRDPNQYCAKCHKFNDQQFHGTHLSQVSPNTGKPITCVSCHGKISEDHRRGVKDVMRFHGDIFDGKTPMYTVQEQNQVCFACHKPEKLREKFWAHDVHAMKLPCTSCHTLHPEHDAMKDIQPKQRVKLCVDCHGKQQAIREEKAKQPTKDAQ